MPKTRPPHTITAYQETRRQEWLAIFGTTTLPAKSPLPGRVNLPGIPNALVYELDLNAITAAQRQRLVAHIATKFGYDIEQDILPRHDKIRMNTNATR